MGADQPVHWVIIAIVAVLLFGGYKKMPEMARSAGRSLRIFKTEMKGMASDDEERASAAKAEAPAPVTYVTPAQPVVTALPAPTAQPAAPAPSVSVHTVDPSAPNV